MSSSNSPKARSASAKGSPNGTVDIVHSAVDNAVAMIDVAKVDVVIVSGGDSGTNEFYVQDTIKNFSDIRGHAIVVDATNTAYALQAKKILLQHGLRTAPTIRSMRSATARCACRPCSTTRTMPAPSSTCPTRCKPRPKACTASAAPPTCSAPIRPAAPLCGAPGRATTPRRWKIISPPLSKRCAGRSIRKTAPRPSAILVDKLKLPQDIAEKSLALMAEPGFGFARDAAFDMAGFKNVLALRAEVEGGTPADPQRYIDLSYYDRAMKLVNK